MQEDLPIECEAGWLSLILSCHEELLALDPSYKPVQIKEKFGALRYYFDTSYGPKDSRFVQMWETIYSYERRSIKICETCGEPGRLVKERGWIKTRCKDHVRFAES